MILELSNLRSSSCKDQLTYKMAKMIMSLFRQREDLKEKNAIKFYSLFRQNVTKKEVYVFTPTKQNKPEHVEKLRTLALELNAIPYICDAQIHDRAVSLISHLPVISTDMSL